MADIQTIVSGDTVNAALLTRSVANFAALQNFFRSGTAPASPVAGQPWLDTSTTPDSFKVRNAANSAWVTWVPDTESSGGGLLPLTGGTMSGAIAMGTSKITGVGNPTAAQDAVTKASADARIHVVAFPVKGFSAAGTLTLGAMPACIVQNAYLTSSAVTVSDGSNLYTLLLRNVTGGVNLMAAAKTTNADDFVVNTAWPLAPAQNLTLALGDVLSLVVSETGTATDLTAAQLSLAVTYKVTT